MIELPVYTDGCLSLYRIIEDTNSDYPVEVMKDEQMEIWFREISVYDKVKYEFDQGGREITMKIRIPQYKKLDSECVCVIDGKQHLVFNATHVKDKYGFPETELTLVRPEKELKIDEEGKTEGNSSQPGDSGK